MEYLWKSQIVPVNLSRLLGICANIYPEKPMFDCTVSMK